MDGAPYRRGPEGVGAPRRLWFLPQCRYLLAPIAALIFVVVVTIWPARPHVFEGAVICQTMHRSMYSTPDFEEWCRCWFPTGLRDVETPLAPDVINGVLTMKNDKGETVDCSNSAEKLRSMVTAPTTLSIEVPPRPIPAGTPVTPESGRRTYEPITLDDALHELSACRSMLDTPYDMHRGEGYVALRLRRIESPSDLPKILVGLGLLLALLPTRRVLVSVDPSSRSLGVREEALFRRAKTVDCTLDEIADVVDGTRGVELVLRNGARLLLTEPDWRPKRWRSRTSNELRRHIASVREL